MIIRYLAGAELKEINSQLKWGGSNWDTVVTRLALAELARPICACDKSNREWFRWQVDLARSGGNNDNVFGAISPEQLNNPFGTRRGHIYAWNQVKNLKLTYASII